MTNAQPAAASPASDDALADLYPPLRLRVTSGDLELRLLRDADLPWYAALLHEPVFADPSAEHVFAWWVPDVEERVRGAIRFQWQVRASIEPAAWELAFGLFHEGRLIGMQSLLARDFAVRRIVSSGSWLTRAEQGRGFGKRMRQMVLVFAFDHLGARRAETGAVLGNEPSFGVSRACGYRTNGFETIVEGGRAKEVQRFALDPDEFVRPAESVQVSGLDGELRAMLGA